MTERINSNAQAFNSAVFHPAGDFSVQAQIPAGSKAKIEVMGQADDAAPFVLLGKVNALSLPPIKRFAKCPNVRLDMSGNDGGATVKAWSGE